MEGAAGNLLKGHVLMTRGMLAAARGQNKQAETLFREIQTTRLPNYDAFGTWYELARLYERQGNRKEAERVYKAALNAFESAEAQLKQEGSRLPFAANAADIYDGYIHLLVEEGRSDEALAAADQSRARTLAQGLGLALRKASSQPRH